MKLFFADLHLSADRPAQTKLFLDCLYRASQTAISVFILGDLFDFWVGDDDSRIPHEEVKSALKNLTDTGVELFITTGNRDFLLGQKFATETGAIMLPDYQVIKLNNERTLVTHGDILCTLDKSYQKFRKIVRNKFVQKSFLSLPVSLRLKIASNTQNQTLKSVNSKTASIMDVDATTVRNLMIKTKTTLLIHGHTHRPQIHKLNYEEGKFHRRVVLGDWYDSRQFFFISEKDSQRLVSASDYLDSANA